MMVGKVPSAIGSSCKASNDSCYVCVPHCSGYDEYEDDDVMLVTLTVMEMVITMLM